MKSRRIASFAAIALASTGFSACGGGSSGGTIVRIAGAGSISKASLEHWMPVEAVVLHREYSSSSDPNGAVPKGVVPDPPTYSACIAYLGSLPQKPTGAQKPTQAQLKNKCVAQYKELKELTLNTLIGWYWAIGAGNALGINISGAEAKQQFAVFTKGSFPKKAELTSYLRQTGQTSSDLLFRSRVQLVQTKLLQRVTAAEKSLPKGLTAQQRQVAIAKLTESVVGAKHWAPKTSCVKGYVVSGCKEYKGPLTPGLPN